MKTVNKITAYSVSSLWFAIIIILSINYLWILQPIFWAVTLALCLPVGIVMESWHSLTYFLLKKIAKKTKFLCIANIITCWLSVEYKQNYKKIGDDFSKTSERYQQLLAENNIIRNMWMSSLMGILAGMLLYFLGFKNNIDATKILIWLPCSLPIMWIANIRTEVLIKKEKFKIYKEGVEHE